VGLLLADGHTHRCATTNYSLNGVGVRLAAPLALEKGATIQVLLRAGDEEQAFAARVVAQRGSNVGLQFLDTSLERQQQLIRCTFGRADAWAHWHEQYAADLPLRGLGEIVRLGLYGYASLLRSAGRALRRRVFERAQAGFETAEF
jgi:cellulose synthase (UDP-forming)